MTKDILVFDVETQRSFADIGGQNEERFGELGVSVLGIYSYMHDTFLSFQEHEMKGFEELLKNTELLIGFNSKRFDIPVIQPHLSNIEMKKIPHIDMLEEVVEVLGRRLKLDNLVTTTLGAGKSGSGLEALSLWKEGRMTELTQYCIDDVRLTRDLYEHGKKNHSVQFMGRDGVTKYTLPINWSLREVTKENIKSFFEKVLLNGWQLKAYYNETESLFGGNQEEEIVLDIYAIGDEVIEGYSHTHKTRKIFKIPALDRLHFTGQQYKVPGNYRRQV